MKRNFIFFLLFIASLSSCVKQNTADIVLHNATIYSFNEEEKIYEAMAIKDGMIIEVGPEHQIMNKYLANLYIDAKTKPVLPQMIDPSLRFENTRGIYGIKTNPLDSFNFYSSNTIEELHNQIKERKYFGVYLDNNFLFNPDPENLETFYTLLNEIKEFNLSLYVESELINKNPEVMKLIKQTLEGYNDFRWQVLNAHLLDSDLAPELVDYNLIPVIPDSINNSEKWKTKIKHIEKVNGLLVISDFYNSPKKYYGSEKELRTKTRINALVLKKEHALGKLEKGFCANFNLYSSSPFNVNNTSNIKIRCFNKGIEQ